MEAMIENLMKAARKVHPSRKFALRVATISGTANIDTITARKGLIERMVSIYGFLIQIG
jgi:hypothetical protein